MTVTRRAQNVAAGNEPGPSPYPSVRAFLDLHAPGLADRAWTRIQASEADYGDSFLWTARRHLVRELEEEVVDAAAWASLTAVRCGRDPDLAGSRERATALLAAIAASTAKTDLLIAQLRPLVELP